MVLICQRVCAFTREKNERSRKSEKARPMEDGYGAVPSPFLPLLGFWAGTHAHEPSCVFQVVRSRTPAIQLAMWVLATLTITPPADPNAVFFI